MSHKANDIFLETKMEAMREHSCKSPNCEVCAEILKEKNIDKEYFSPLFHDKTIADQINKEGEDALT